MTVLTIVLVAVVGVGAAATGYILGRTNANRQAATRLRAADDEVALLRDVNQALTLTVSRTRRDDNHVINVHVDPTRTINHYRDYAAAEVADAAGPGQGTARFFV